ncbi:MAG TPA: type I polyketide synthase [Pseudonocardiaceae bacterium]|nr:type I polyketide synthase [Pseudonocardiaceae bacterium]
MDWSAGAVSLLREEVEWPEVGRPRRAGVSSFGISGTNAHVIIEQPPADVVEVGLVEVGPVPVVVSGRSVAGLRAQAARLAECATESGVGDVASSLVRSRSVFEHRAVVVAADSADLVAGLTAIAQGAPEVVSGRATGGRLAMLFTGQGSQRVGMGRELAARFPVFGEKFSSVLHALDVDSTVLDDEELLARTGFTQRVVFAVEVALVELLGSWGVVPDVVVGHSVGEIAAAHVAGVLSLADACSLVCARADLMEALPAGGAMVAVQATEDEVTPLLTDGVSVAAVNGPGSVVLSGIAELVDEVLGQLGDRRSRRLVVSHAFHSALMDPMVAEFEAFARGVSYRQPRIPLVSTVSGEVVSEEVCSAEYWAGQVRSTVRFADAVSALPELGVTACIEIGPDAVLTPMADEVLADRAAVVPALRADRGEVVGMLGAVGEVFVRGVPVDWAAVVPAGRRVALPTYAFQRELFWPARSRAAATSMIESVVSLAGSDGVVVSGRVSLRRQPWLADHAVGGVVLLPATALVELTLRAGEEVGCPGLAELTLVAPLVVGERDTLVQVTVGAPDPADGQRSIAVHARADDDGEEWTEHATGQLATQISTVDDGASTELPVDALGIDVADVYDRLADSGLDYGPGFRGLRVAWRHGGDVYADIVIPDLADDEFAVHPALFDSALHAISLLDEHGVGARLPFSWSGVRQFSGGVAELRVRVRAVGTDAVSLVATDRDGIPVLIVESLVLRSIEREQLPAAGNDMLFQLDWQRIPGLPEHGSASVRTLDWLADLDTVTESSDAVVVVVPEDVAGPREVTGRALELVRQWLSQDADDGRLVFVTRIGAVAAAGVWGLVRVAQSEHPDRFGLIEADDLEVSLTQAVASGEPQVRISGGVIQVPRLARAKSGIVEPAAWDARRPVLITGGTGGLGGVLARHLVAQHGVRRLLLVSRRGPAAPGATELEAELVALGADVTVLAADLSERHTVEGILLRYEPAAVVHTAGALQDALLTSLTDEDLDVVFDAKVEPARHLDELTRDSGLTAFIVFSSLAGTMGNPGQGNYAAANAVVDEIVRQRRVAGLPGQSLAWGPWADTGMTTMLADSDLHRMAREGTLPLTTEQGLRLFDLAATADSPVVVPAELDLAVARGHFGGHRGRRGPAGARSAQPATAEDLVRSLFPLSVAERSAAVLALVREQVAAVLGYAGAAAIPPDRSFQDLGFESLSAIELRNRLNIVVGLRLPATLVFDHPTPTALAAHLQTELGLADDDGSAALLAELAGLERSLGQPRVDAKLHEQVLARLDTLRGKWAALADPADGASTEDLDEVSDTEMFDMLDNELGLA